MPGGYSGIDFKTVGAQLAWWITPKNITQYFKGGFSGSGENGIDIGLPHGTPVYAITSGKLVGAGYYNGGGVVAIEEKPGTVWYYQHLDLDQVPVPPDGRTIYAGEQIGLSGGQLSGGNHPATCCSGGDHIEIGINGPFGSGSIWHPEGPNINPLPFLQGLLTAFSSADVKTVGPGQYSGGYTPIYTTGTSGVTPSTSGTTGQEESTGTQRCWQLPLGFPKICVPNAFYNFLTQPIRWVKLLVGTALMTVGALLFIVPAVAGPALQVGGAVSGQPEVVTAGRFLSRSRGRRRATGRATTMQRAKAGQRQRVATEIERRKANKALTDLRVQQAQAAQQPPATPKAPKVRNLGGGGGGKPKQQAAAPTP